MNNQNIHQFYNNPSSSCYVDNSEVDALQIQQQQFMKQQHEYLIQQRQLQKQFEREEQRNKLKNMNIKSMGAPLLQYPTHFFQNTSVSNSLISNQCNQSYQSFHSNQLSPNTMFQIPQQNPVYTQQFTPSHDLSTSDSFLSNISSPVYGDQSTACNVDYSKTVIDGISKDLLTSPGDDFGEFTFSSPQILSNIDEKQASCSKNVFVESSDFSHSSDIFPDDTLSSQSKNKLDYQESFVLNSKVNAGSRKEHIPDQNQDDYFSCFQDADLLAQKSDLMHPPLPSSKHDQQNLSGYIPGTMTNDDQDTSHSVEFFSNPLKVENSINYSSSEFDSLIQLSPTAAVDIKTQKSNSLFNTEKSLLKSCNTSISQSCLTNSTQSAIPANWLNLDVSNLFARPSEEIGDSFSAIENRHCSVKGNAPCEFISQNQISPVTGSSDLLLNLDKPVEPCLNPFAGSFHNHNLESVPSCLGQKLSESSEPEWSDFKSTNPNSNEKKVDSYYVSKEDPVVDLSKLPQIYNDIIDFCKTPSGIMDVSKIYQVMLTDKFTVTLLQPLMEQCKMMSCPKVKDLIDLIGLVGMKQNGYSTPSASEINYEKLNIPSINISVLTEKISEKEKNQTLLSFVENEPMISKAAIIPVFDFGSSSNKNLASAPFASADTPDGMNDWGEFGIPYSKNTSFVLANNPDMLAKTNDWADFCEPLGNDRKYVSFPETQQSDETNDWGDFGTAINEPTSCGIEVKQTLDLKYCDTNKSKHLNDREVFENVTLPKSIKPSSIKLDEPPPLPDNEEDDWAEFAHPGQIWDIDHGEIDELVKNNIGTKNRWNNSGLKPKIEHDNYKFTDFEEKFDIDYDVDDQNSIEAVEVKETSESTSVTSPTNNLGNNQSDFINTKSKSNIDQNKILRSYDRLASLEDKSLSDDISMQENQEVQSIAPFSYADKLSSNLVGVSLTTDSFDMHIEENVLFGGDVITGDVLTNCPPIEFAKDTDSSNTQKLTMNTAADDDNNFNDLNSCTGSCVDKDDRAKSLKLQNLPQKDLDCFWNDMVDSLGPKLESFQPFEDKFDTSSQNTYSDIAIVQSKYNPSNHVSYDAFKDDQYSSEEDKLGAWSKCLSLILTILINCHKILGSSNSSTVHQEVIESGEGSNYLECCTEVFKVACRISISGAAEDGILEIFKEIKHTWTLISEMLDENTVLPTLREFNIKPCASEVEIFHKNCSICLLGTEAENSSHKLEYNGNFYHVTCANFWINSVNSLLPNLKPHCDNKEEGLL